MKEGTNRPQCDIGKPVACNDIIRLEHVDTRKNLHSHLFKAPLSGNQEVSGYGDDQGNGDTGDNWQVSFKCSFSACGTSNVHRVFGTACHIVGIS